MSSPADLDYDACGSGVTLQYKDVVGEFRPPAHVFPNSALISSQDTLFEHNCSFHSFGTYVHIHLAVAPSDLVLGHAEESSYVDRKPPKSFAFRSF